MNYYELIYLLGEFKTKFLKSWLKQSVTPFKNQLELFIENEEDSFRLIFNSSPGNSALFLDSFRPAKKTNTQQFFETIYGLPIQEIKLEENERLISFCFEDGYRLWFKLFGSKANAVLSKDERIIETFKDRDAIGDDEPTPLIPELFSINIDNTLPADRKLQVMLPILPKAWIKKLSEYHSFKDYTDEELLKFSKEIDLTLRTKAEFRILNGEEVSLIPESLLPAKTVDTTDNVNELVRIRFKNYAHNQRLHQRKSVLIKSIKRQLKRLESALQNLYQADKGLEKANQYEKYAHILMANAHHSISGETNIELDDLYRQGHKIQIPLLRALNLAENAQRYYSRSSNSILSYQESIDKIPKLESKRTIYSDLLEEIETINDMRVLTEWAKTNRNYLSILEQNTRTKEEPSNAFYVKEYMGFTIWIGKNARSNDILVQKSHKEDIWLHARGVSGSHVLIRMNNSKNQPELIIIEEIASFAAYQSKAKGSQLVPVIYTKRKFIRKPKGAAPGAVLVQKENVLIVEPKNPFE